MALGTPATAAASFTAPGAQRRHPIPSPASTQCYRKPWKTECSSCPSRAVSCPGPGASKSVPDQAGSQQAQGPHGEAPLHCGLRTKSVQAAGMAVPACECGGPTQCPSRRAKLAGRMELWVQRSPSHGPGHPPRWHLLSLRDRRKGAALGPRGNHLQMPGPCPRGRGCCSKRRGVLPYDLSGRSWV